MRILLVEDDELLASGMVTRLKRMGYQPEHCTTGTQALQAAQASSFELMILDLGLPESKMGEGHTLDMEIQGLPKFVLPFESKGETFYLVVLFQKF